VWSRVSLVFGFGPRDFATEGPPANLTTAEYVLKFDLPRSIARTWHRTKGPGNRERLRTARPALAEVPDDERADSEDACD
jgi:hypothetical protein